MSEMQNEKSFKEMLEESWVSVRKGEVVEGTIIAVKEDEITVNIGYKSDGIIPKNEFSNNPPQDLRTAVTIGDRIRTKVLKVNDSEGQVLLTYKRLKSEEGLAKVEEYFNEQKEITATVAKVLSGGLVAIVNEVRIFIPASLVSDTFVGDLNKFKNQEITFLITEFNQRKNRIIGNRKILIDREKREKRAEAFEGLKVGDEFMGTVKNITDYGVFVNINGVDGLVHISELTWGRVRSPKHIVKPGQKVRVRIINIDDEKKKISLSMKFDDENPWNDVEVKYAVGSVVSGRVARMTEFGAFIELEDGVDALLHVSQIAIRHVEKPSDALKVNEVIEAKVTDINLEEQKISLSIKELELDKEAEKASSEGSEEVDEPAEATEVVEKKEVNEVEEAQEAQEVKEDKEVEEVEKDKEVKEEDNKVEVKDETSEDEEQAKEEEEKAEVKEPEEEA